MPEYDRNEYGEILNGPGTFAALAEDLRYGPVMLDWNDERSSLLNVCFARPKRVQCPIGGGNVDTRNGLVVAVMGIGAYQFTAPTEWSYVAEKLKLAGGSAIALTDLINAALAGAVLV